LKAGQALQNVVDAWHVSVDATTWRDREPPVPPIADQGATWLRRQLQTQLDGKAVEGWRFGIEIRSIRRTFMRKGDQDRLWFLARALRRGLGDLSARRELAAPMAPACGPRCGSGTGLRSAL